MAISNRIKKYMAENEEATKKEALIAVARENDKGNKTVKAANGIWIRIPKGANEKQAIRRFKKLHKLE